jgi:hypothetical protein
MGELKIGGLIEPGHVSAIIGVKPYEIISRRYNIPQVVAGFEPLDLAIRMFLRDLINILQDSGYFGAVEPLQFVTKPLMTICQYGDTSEVVRWIQFTLKTLKYFPRLHECTGYYGDLTAQAVLAWQKDVLNLSWYETYILKR